MLCQGQTNKFAQQMPTLDADWEGYKILLWLFESLNTTFGSSWCLAERLNNDLFKRIYIYIYRERERERER